MCKAETAAGGKKDLGKEGFPKGKEGTLKTWEDLDRIWL